MRRLFGTGVLVGALVMTGCGSSNSDPVDSTSVAVTAPSSVETTTSLQVANTDVFTLVGGGSIDLTRGPTAMPMALWFWAPG
ncbi:unannotated protein [freshwater metagenome]|uniref:Unannotated protein n=1 Tax=freshwater metagenome TaxID=449393 RepID=A0A6J6LZ59_9ZZZZ